MFVGCTQSLAGGKESEVVVPETIGGKTTLIVRFPDEDFNQEVTFDQGNTVMDILHENLDVEEINGEVVSINGIQQDYYTGTYGMHNIMALCLNMVLGE